MTPIGGGALSGHHINTAYQGDHLKSTITMVKRTYGTKSTTIDSISNTPLNNFSHLMLAFCSFLPNTVIDTRHCDRCPAGSRRGSERSL